MISHFIWLCICANLLMQKFDDGLNCSRHIKQNFYFEILCGFSLYPMNEFRIQLHFSEWGLEAIISIWRLQNESRLIIIYCAFNLTSLFHKNLSQGFVDVKINHALIKTNSFGSLLKQMISVLCSSKSDHETLQKKVNFIWNDYKYESKFLLIHCNRTW